MPATYIHPFALRNKANGRYFVAVPVADADEPGMIAHTYEDTCDASVPFCEPPTLFATIELAEEVAKQIMRVEPGLQVTVEPVSCILK